jgi:Mg/Co/Ni transporter MgtE
MSPRAAWRLESYGYERVYDYVPGKADWLAFNLPREGFARLAGDVIRRDVPTCGFRERLAEVRDRLAASEYGMLVALNQEGIVMGRLDRGALQADPDSTVDRLMREGPTTVRPSEELDAIASRMRNADIDGVLVTSSDGRLLGMLTCEDAELALSESAR